MAGGTLGIRQLVGGGKRLGLYGNMANVNTGRAYLGAIQGGCMGAGRRMRGGNAPWNNFNYASNY